jgi:tetratricopeptide (TPR) repeat protein
MQFPSADRSSNVDGVPSQPRLVGWKEIAAYFEKAERTVKRWEQDRNLPVYRVPGGSSASVFAYPSELKNWLEADPSDKPETGTVAKSVDASPSGGASEVMTLDAFSASNAGQAAPPPHWLKRNWRWAAAAAGLVAIAAVSSLLLFGDARLRLPDRVHALFGRKTAKSAPKAANLVSDVERAQAHDFYLKGRYEWNQRTPESLNRALDDFTQAIVHDPGDAEAYAGLADTYDLLREYSTIPDLVVFPRAIAAAKKAVELDDSLAEGHRALAFAEMYGNWDFVDAEKEFRRAIELNPNDPQARRWYANAFAVSGRFSESLSQITRAQELDPGSHATLADKGIMLYEAGRTDQGIEILKDVERSAPEFRSPHCYLMMIGLYRQDYPTFLREGQKTAEVMKDPVLADIIASARAGYAKAGGRGLLESLYAAQKKYFLRGKLDATTLAETCVMMGRRQEALQLLEGAYNRREANLLSCLSRPDLLTLRDDPRYMALVKKINFPADSTNASPTYLAELAKQPLQRSSNPH